MQWDDSVNSSPTTTITISFCKSFSSLSSEALRFGQKCFQNAVSSISTNVNFSWVGGALALPPIFFLNFLDLPLPNQIFHQLLPIGKTVITDTPILWANSSAIQLKGQ